MLIICKLQLSKSFIISCSVPYAFSCPSLSEEEIGCVPCDLEPTTEQQAELQSKRGVRSFMEAQIQLFLNSLAKSVEIL